MDLAGDMELAEAFVHYVVGRVLAEREQLLSIRDRLNAGVPLTPLATRWLDELADPGRRPRVDLALRPGGVLAILNGLCAAAEAVEAPAVTAPVVFRTLWSLWGGAASLSATDEV